MGLSDMEELKAEVRQLTERFHTLDRAHAVLATSVGTLSSNVGVLSTAVTALTDAINQQKGAVAIAKWAWTAVAALGGSLVTLAFKR